MRAAGAEEGAAQPEEESYWFSEGFTDHFARHILREAGWLDDQEYADSLNTMLRDYYTSPMRNVAAPELAAQFWQSSLAQRQPYKRGDLVAHVLAHAFEEATGGDMTLGDFMRELLIEARAKKISYSTEDLLGRLEEIVGEGLIAVLRKIVVDGETIELHPDTFGAGFRLDTIRLPMYDPGFDTGASRSQMKVVGLRKGSAAEKAGLKEGATLTSLSFEAGRTDLAIKVSMRLKPNAPVVAISYLPRGEIVDVPRVRVAQ